MAEGNTTQATAAPAAGPLTLPLKAAIISPWVDALCIGGGSILVLAPLLLWGNSMMGIMSPAVQATLGVLLNTPHFMASYRIIYRSKAMVQRHPWAAIYIPALLAAYCVFAVLNYATEPIHISILTIIASVYLAWHYTGQTWGMMASFAYLSGTPFDAKERMAIRLGLRLMLCWHVTWFFYWSNELAWVSYVAEPIYSVMCQITMVSFALGAVGIAAFVKRTRRLPPVHVLVAWASIYFWYAAMARDVRAIYWAQLAHAVQYLIFPARVELNNETARSGGAGRQVMGHMIWYGVLLLLAAVGFEMLVVTYGTPLTNGILGSKAAAAVPAAGLAFLNIHHYFTDGCVWKISNPEVRKELFAHVPKEPKGTSPKAGAQGQG